MPIPDYQTIMLPLLQLLADKNEYISGKLPAGHLSPAKSGY